jgi:hypothetical protein
VTFGGTSTAYANTALPSGAQPNRIVAPWWDDGYVATNNNLTYALTGVAPHRTLVVQWSGWRQLYGTATRDMQVRLEETTGNISIDYGPIGTPSPDSATVGYEDALGSAARSGSWLACSPNCTSADWPAQTRVTLVADTAMRFDELPAAVQRRALQYQGRLLAMGTVTSASPVRAGDVVRPLYRPDKEQPAYWEISLRDGEGMRSGFLVLSSGSHDNPVVETSMHGQSPTDALISAARARGESAVKFYRLGGGSYVAEDATGRDVARMGSPMYRVTVNPALAGSKGGIKYSDGTESWSSGFVEADSTVTGYASWAEERASFTVDQAAALAGDQARAAAAWAVEDRRQAGGEGILQDMSRLIPLPAGAVDATFGVTGSGAGAVQSTVVTLPSGVKALQVAVTGAYGAYDAPFTVQADYTLNGAHRTENLGFNALGRDVPLGRCDDCDGMNDDNPNPPPPQYTYDDHQWDIADYGEWTPPYNQIPNTWRMLGYCNSGCGPTAWGIFIGYYDRHASWGWELLRQNASTNGLDVLAPNTWDPNATGASDIRALIVDIGGAAWDKLGTSCAGNESWTVPFRMAYGPRYMRDRLTLTSFNGVPPRLEDDQMREDAILGRTWITDGTRHRFVDAPQPMAIGYKYHYAVLEGYREFYVITTFPNGTHKTDLQDWQFIVNPGWGSGSNGHTYTVKESLWYQAEVSYIPGYDICAGRTGNDLRCCRQPHKPGCPGFEGPNDPEP